VRVNESGRDLAVEDSARSFVANNYRSRARSRVDDGGRRALLMKFVDVYRRRVGRSVGRRLIARRRRRRPASNLWTDGRRSDRAIRRTDRQNGGRARDGYSRPRSPAVHSGCFTSVWGTSQLPATSSSARRSSVTSGVVRFAAVDRPQAGTS